MDMLKTLQAQMALDHANDIDREIICRMHAMALYGMSAEVALEFTALRITFPPLSGVSVLGQNRSGLAWGAARDHFTAARGNFPELKPWVWLLSRELTGSGDPAKGAVFARRPLAPPDGADPTAVLHPSVRISREAADLFFTPAA